MKNIYITSAIRTAVGSLGKSLKNINDRTVNGKNKNIKYLISRTTPKEITLSIKFLPKSPLFALKHKYKPNK